MQSLLDVNVLHLGIITSPCLRLQIIKIQQRYKGLWGHFNLEGGTTDTSVRSRVISVSLSILYSPVISDRVRWMIGADMVADCGHHQTKKVFIIKRLALHSALNKSAHSCTLDKDWKLHWRPRLSLSLLPWSGSDYIFLLPPFTSHSFLCLSQRVRTVLRTHTIWRPHFSTELASSFVHCASPSIDQSLCSPAKGWRERQKRYYSFDTISRWILCWVYWEI